MTIRILQVSFAKWYTNYLLVLHDIILLQLQIPYVLCYGYSSLCRTTACPQQNSREPSRDLLKLIYSVCACVRVDMCVCVCVCVCARMRAGVCVPPIVTMVQKKVYPCSANIQRSSPGTIINRKRTSGGSYRLIAEVVLGRVHIAIPEQ